MLMSANSNPVQDEGQLAFLLICAIVFLAAASAIFILLTFFYRVKKIKKLEQIRLYQKQAEELLFPLLFGTATMEQTLENYEKIEQNRLLRSVLIRSIVSLHRNYTGLQKSLLEDFFVQSELGAYSRKKLRSGRWDITIEGIREVGALNVQEAFADLEKLTSDSNKQVQKEAFVGLLTLRGTAALETITLPEIAIDDWTQSCILYNLSTKQYTVFDHLDVLLQAQNETLVVLAARIIEYFQLYTQYESVLTMDRQFHSARNQRAMLAIRNRLNAQFIP